MLFMKARDSLDCDDKLSFDESEALDKDYPTESMNESEWEPETSPNTVGVDDEDDQTPSQPLLSDSKVHEAFSELQDYFIDKNLARPLNCRLGK